MAALDISLQSAHMKKFYIVKVRKNQNIKNKEASVSITKVRTRKNFKGRGKAYTPRKIMHPMKNKMMIV